MKRYIKSNFSGQFVSNYYKNNKGKFRYTVSWLSPEGKYCLLGGSNNPDEAARIAYEQAQEVFTNPWETDERKILFLRNLEIVDNQTDKLVEDAKLVGYESLAPSYVDDLIDGMMSELDTKIKSKKTTKVNASSYPIPSIQEIARARRELETNFDDYKVDYVRNCYNDVVEAVSRFYTDYDPEDVPDRSMGIDAIKNDWLLGAIEDDLMTEEEFNHIYFLIETVESEDAIAQS